jgi:hypothetical protein
MATDSSLKVAGELAVAGSPIEDKKRRKAWRTLPVIGERNQELSRIICTPRTNRRSSGRHPNP